MTSPWLNTCSNSLCVVAVIYHGVVMLIMKYMYFNIFLLQAGNRFTYPRRKARVPEKCAWVCPARMLKKLGGYRLSEDNPKMFTVRKDFLTLDREFPDEGYPEGADTDTQPSAVSDVPSTSKESDPGLSKEVRKAKEEAKGMILFCWKEAENQIGLNWHQAEVVKYLGAELQNTLHTEAACPTLQSGRP